jgi:Phosphotransferase enzyme family
VKQPGSPETPFERMIEAALAQVTPWDGLDLRYEPGPPPIASPLQRGMDAACAVVVAGDQRWLLKAYHPEIRDELALPTVALASARAAAAGVAPPLYFAAPGALVFDWFALPWREARLADLCQPDILVRALRATRQFHATGLLGSASDPFAEPASEHAALVAAGAILPPDAAWLLDQVTTAQAAMQAAGMDRVPCRRTGVASDLLIDDKGAVALVDFDRSGDGDPWHDFALLMNEACVFDDDLSAALEAFHGRADPSLLARCRVYGAVDDVAWGLRGLRLAAVSERRGMEFFKYGQWRLLRARLVLQGWDFEAMLRRL